MSEIQQNCDSFDYNVWIKFYSRSKSCYQNRIYVAECYGDQDPGHQVKIQDVKNILLLCESRLAEISKKQAIETEAFSQPNLPSASLATDTIHSITTSAKNNKKRKRKKRVQQEKKRNETQELSYQTFLAEDEKKWNDYFNLFVVFMQTLCNIIDTLPENTEIDVRNKYIYCRNCFMQDSTNWHMLLSEVPRGLFMDPNEKFMKKYADRTIIAERIHEHIKMLFNRTELVEAFINTYNSIPAIPSFPIWSSQSYFLRICNNILDLITPKENDIPIPYLGENMFGAIKFALVTWHVLCQYPRLRKRLGYNSSISFPRTQFYKNVSSLDGICTATESGAHPVTIADIEKEMPTTLEVYQVIAEDEPFTEQDFYVASYLLEPKNTKDFVLMLGCFYQLSNFKPSFKSCSTS